MSALTKKTATNRSGCVGVCMVKRQLTLKGGIVVVRWWWQATLGSRVRRFSIDALGNREAYRAAVQARAEWVREQAPIEQARRKANKKRGHATWCARYPEKNRQRHRTHRADNLDHINAQRRQREGKDRERFNKRQRQYIAKNRVHINAQKRARKAQQKGASK